MRYAELNISIFCRVQGVPVPCRRTCHLARGQLAAGIRTCLQLGGISIRTSIDVPQDLARHTSASTGCGRTQTGPHVSVHVSRHHVPQSTRRSVALVRSRCRCQRCIVAGAEHVGVNLCAEHCPGTLGRCTARGGGASSCCPRVRGVRSVPHRHVYTHGVARCSRPFPPLPPPLRRNPSPGGAAGAASRGPSARLRLRRDLHPPGGHGHTR